MKIQQVQPINNQTPFQAHFVYDKKGNFKNLWMREKSANTKIFKSYLDKFTNNHKGQAIEVTDLNFYRKGENINFDVTLFNQSNGKSLDLHYDDDFSTRRPLRAILTSLVSKKDAQAKQNKWIKFFSTDEKESEVYKQLLGKQ